MVMSKREKYIGIIVAVAIGIFALDRIVVTPLLDRKADLDSKLASGQQELIRVNDLIVNSRRATGRWSEMSGNTLRRDASEAESVMLNSVREWAQDAGMSLPIVTPER